MAEEKSNYMYTTVALGFDTKDRLETFGKKGDTFDTILRRLMDFAKKHGMPTTSIVVKKKARREKVPEKVCA